MIIRTETTLDHEAVYRLNVRAFGNRDDEAKLVEKIRSSEGFIPELSLVAERDGEIVGHLLLSKAVVTEEGGSRDVIVLAPIAVKPEEQRRGIGSRLISEGLDRCRILGYDLVLLVGHPEYYPKFGFKPARTYGLELRQFDVSDDVFMACELREGALNEFQGELRYPQAFF
ncbi:GNAT family N-acetyltransferase [Paenibacillaceae bacterium WGS1546]|uniref:GNAT family N-acetyltransferase n=1 Tax=Cohnella sp. WGS1546 TaxID=3366810 RepID=UPI00372D8461